MIVENERKTVRESKSYSPRPAFRPYGDGEGEESSSSPSESSSSSGGGPPGGHKAVESELRATTSDSVLTGGYSPRPSGVS